MSVLSIKNLNKSYGKIQALNNLNLEIEAGNVYGILGPNGSGKTTTLGIILGILAQDSGSFEWFGGQYGEHHRLKIGSILETPNFYPYLNAEENLKIVARIKGAKQRNFDELLEKVNLSQRKKSKFRTYSLGMKQRLAIAATLVGDPEVLIFDEPTNGLDPQGIAEVRSILSDVANSGRTVIMASHLLDEVEKICSHVAIIKKGNLLKTGPVGALLSNDTAVQIAAENKEQLLAMLQGLPYIKNISSRNNIVECMMDSERSITELSAAAFKDELLLTHLVCRKQSLEEEFLEITKQQ